MHAGIERVAFGRWGEGRRRAAPRGGCTGCGSRASCGRGPGRRGGGGGRGGRSSWGSGGLSLGRSRRLGRGRRGCRGRGRGARGGLARTCGLGAGGFTPRSFGRGFWFCVRFRRAHLVLHFPGEARVNSASCRLHGEGGGGPASGTPRRSPPPSGIPATPPRSPRRGTGSTVRATHSAWWA